MSRRPRVTTQGCKPKGIALLGRYLAYGGVYTLLEILAVPAVPLTMTAGVIFGPVAGSIVVSVAATAAATIAFLIARYAGALRPAAHACS